jgi:cholesterol oxidase
VPACTEHLVSWVPPLDSDGNDSPDADGSHGYRVYYNDLNDENTEESSLRAQRVIVCAGSVGSSEILLRCKFQYGTLPRISAALGKSWSANGDLLAAVMGTKETTGSVYGPVITQRIDFDLFDKFDRTRAFILEDAGFPNLLAWVVQTGRPGFMWLAPLWRSISHM